MLPTPPPPSLSPAPTLFRKTHVWQLRARQWLPDAVPSTRAGVFDAGDPIRLRSSGRRPPRHDLPRGKSPRKSKSDWKAETDRKR